MLSKIDFHRYGQFMIFGALLIGLFLSRHAGNCFVDRVEAFDLGGVADDGKSRVVDEQGNVSMRNVEDGKGDYAENFNKGSGFFGYMAGSIPHCIEQEPFDDPKWAHTAFLALIGLGIVSMGLGRVIKPEWKNEIKRRSAEQEEAFQEKERAFAQQREARKRTSTQASKAIDVEEFGISSGLPENNKDMSSMLMRNEDHVSSTSIPARPTKKKRRRKPKSGLMGASASTSSMSSEKQKELSDLGIGSLDADEGNDWLSDNSVDGPSSVDERRRKPAKKLARSRRPSATGESRRPPSSSGQAPPPPSSRRARPPRNSSKISRTGRPPASRPVRAASASRPVRAASASRPVRAASASRPVRAASASRPIRPPSSRTTRARAGSQKPPRNPSSAQLAKSAAPPPSQARPTRQNTSPGSAPPARSNSSVSMAPPSSPSVDQLRRYWIPAGHEQDKLLFVTHDQSKASHDPTAGTSEDHPLGSIGEAMVRAQEHLREGKTVQLRLQPGTYKEAVEVSEGVSLINHALPRGLDSDAMRHWLAESGDNHVILALPESAKDDIPSVRLHKAHKSILAGIHVVGRSEITPDGPPLSSGISITDTREATIYLCHVVGHRTTRDGAAVEIQNSGEDASTRIILQDCLLEGNATAHRGGGVFIHKSRVALRGCAIQANESGQAGGGIFADEIDGVPLFAEQCLISENSVSLPGKLPRASRGGWSGEVGHGGGIFVQKADLHLRQCDVQDNQAQGAGGGIFAAASRLMLEGNRDTNDLSGRISGNKALRGGGILLSGAPASASHKATALKAKQIDLLGNQAQESGGAIACFRLSQVDMVDSRMQQNQVSAEFGEGGALHANLGSRVSLKQVAVEKNTAQYRGGGMSLCNSSLRIFEGCKIVHNTTEQGDCGGMAFYTMTSNYIEDLRSTGLLEEPVVFAMAPCEIKDNAAIRGIGGLFVGNFVKDDTPPVHFTIQDPSLIAENLLADKDGELKTSEEFTRPRPVDLVVAWKGVIQADENQPPIGKRLLR